MSILNFLGSQSKKEPAGITFVVLILNSDNGFIIRDSANGQFPINTYKYNAYFQELSEQVRKDIALNKEYRIFAEQLGFRHVESSPLVRSSYHAEKHIH